MHKNIQKFWIFQSTRAISSSLTDVDAHIENPLAMELKFLLFTKDFELELAKKIEKFCPMQQPKVADLERVEFYFSVSFEIFIHCLRYSFLGVFFSFVFRMNTLV